MKRRGSLLISCACSAGLLTPPPLPLSPSHPLLFTTTPHYPINSTAPLSTQESDHQYTQTAPLCAVESGVLAMGVLWPPPLCSPLRVDLNSTPLSPLVAHTLHTHTHLSDHTHVLLLLLAMCVVVLMCAVGVFGVAVERGARRGRVLLSTADKNRPSSGDFVCLVFLGALYARGRQKSKREQTTG